jgi:cytoskeletal protein CcmA (bactofilin family)
MPIGEDVTIVGRSMEIRGEIAGEDDLQIDGAVEGTIRLNGAKLTIGATGRVRSLIVAPDVLILGHVEGEIHATGCVSLRAGSRFVGEIFAARISVEDGASLRCRLDPERAAEPVGVGLNEVSGKIQELHRTLDAWLTESAAENAS